MADELPQDISSQEKPKGRGWHGNSQGHAKAGQKGGRARRKKNTESPEIQ